MSLTRIPAKVGKALARKYGKKRRGNRRRQGASRVGMPKQITGNFASRKEQFSVAVTAGMVYDFTTSIKDVPVCQALASLYQYYRVTSVELRFKADFDTYVAGGSAGTGVLPYLNFQYDKAGTLQGSMNAANFESLGTKSIRLDDKTLVRRWRPSVITEDNAVVSTATQFKVSPWLPTHLLDGTPNEPNHYGACFYISKINPSDNSVYDVDVVVNYQFRKPFIPPATSDPSIMGGNPPRAVQQMYKITLKETGPTGPA